MIKQLKIGLIIVFTLFAVSVIGAGEMLSRPAKHSVGNPPEDLHAKSVEILSANHEKVSGWVVRGQKNFGVILLLHGVRSDRWSMVGRAKFLNKLGYSVVLIDLPAHGESAGERITYGRHEAEGVSAALVYISEEFPAEKIGIIGTSLGAASFVFARSAVKPNAVVLESMYPTIEEAVSDRLSLHLGSLGKSLTPLLLLQLPLWENISSDQLMPIADLPSMHSPVLIAAGSIDKHTTLAETKRLFDSANSPKELWIVEGAAHVDLHHFNEAVYEVRISTFLDKYMHNVN
jgi:pimeloyl-ACP methyl ester carboxylesterase